MSELLQKNLLDNWQQCNEVILEFLKNISETLYSQKPFAPRFKSFAWEFSCILTTREMYLNGLKEGRLDGKTFAMKQKDAEKLSRKEMVKILKDKEKELTKMIKEREQQGILFFGTKTSELATLSWLCQHEQLHFGKLMLMCAQVNISLPKALKTMWGWK